MGHQHSIAAPDGATLARSSTGSGDPVVLVHGIAESARSWDPVVERLSTSHEVITLDPRGHGESSGADTYGLEGMAGDVLAAETMLRDPDPYRAVVDAMFEMMSGQLLSADDSTRLDGVRRADHEVVLGAWELLLTQPADQIAATVDEALAGYRDREPPYLAISGVDPGAGYAGWLRQRTAGAEIEYWADHGHYPHVVDPDRFVARLRRLWS